MPDPAKRRTGCLIYALITGLLVLLGIILGIYFGTRQAISYAVENYTTNAPAAIPVLEIPPSQQKQIASALLNQATQVMNQKGPAEIALTETDLNVLIAQSPNLRGYQKQVYLKPDGNQLRAFISLPLDQFPDWTEFTKKMHGEKWRGRYLNGTAILGLSVSNNILQVFPKKIIVRATTLPDEFTRRFPWDKLTQSANSDPDVKAVLTRVESIDVQDSKVRVRFRE